MLTLGNNIYSRQKWNKSLFKEDTGEGNDIIGKTLQSENTLKCWIYWFIVLFIKSDKLYFVWSVCQQPFLTIMWFSASRLKRTTKHSFTSYRPSNLLDVVWPWKTHTDLGQTAAHAYTHRHAAYKHTQSSRDANSSEDQNVIIDEQYDWFKSKREMQRNNPI